MAKCPAQARTAAPSDGQEQKRVVLLLGQGAGSAGSRTTAGPAAGRRPGPGRCTAARARRRTAARGFPGDPGGRRKSPGWPAPRPGRPRRPEHPPVAAAHRDGQQHRHGRGRDRRQRQQRQKVREAHGRPPGCPASSTEPLSRLRIRPAAAHWPARPPGRPAGCAGTGWRGPGPPGGTARARTDPTASEASTRRSRQCSSAGASRSGGVPNTVLRSRRTV